MKKKGIKKSSLQSKKLTKKPVGNVLSADLNIGGVNLTQKALLAKHLSVMLKAGLTIVDALQIAIESSTGKLKNVLMGVLRSVESGNSLSSSLDRYPKIFGGIFISSTYAGEASGTLDENLEIMADQLEKEKEIMTKIKGAMLYPIVILVAAFILGMSVAFLILPKITPLFEGLDMKLPFTTRTLIWFSHLVQNHGMVLFVSIVAGLIFLLWLVKQKFSRPVTHWLTLKIPVVRKIVFNANIARLCRTLGTLLRSGLTIDEALLVTKDTISNYYFKKSLVKIVGNVGRGSKLSDNLANYPHLFPTMVRKMIKVGEESGELEDVLLYLAKFYEVEVDNSTKSLATAVEPALLIFIGLIVAFLALSIITPIYNITGNIR